MDPESLFLKIQGADSVSLEVVLPLSHRHEVMKKKDEEGYGWLGKMLRDERIYFVDDFLELLECAFEGEKVMLIDDNKRAYSC